MTSTGIRIHPIRTESDHERAVVRIAELMGAAPGSHEGDELDVLATLVDAYEAKHHAMEAPDPVTAIQFRMEQRGLKRKDLEPLIGSRARVSEVLTGKRNLTLDMVRRVKSGWESLQTCSSAIHRTFRGAFLRIERRGVCAAEKP